jgi:hypothetical protein
MDLFKQSGHTKAKELVPNGRTISAEVYSQQSEKMYMVLLEK